MSRYFNRFPKVYYSFSDDENIDIVTDITFAVRVLEPYASDNRFYYKAIIKDGLKPEDIAHMVYGDVELHWIILMFNKVIDPRYDWPLSSVNFDKYIIEKYGSVSAAYSETKRYYKVIQMLSSTSDERATQKIEINSAEYANVSIDLAGTDYVVGDESVTIFINRELISAYDWELEQNEARREIYLIQNEYMDRIKSAFNTLADRNR